MIQQLKRNFSTIAIAALALASCSLPVYAQQGQTVNPDTPLIETTETGQVPRETANSIETHRLRIVNRKDGAIQVSTDGGETWRLLGRVLVPATTVQEGYLAANYADHGTVAATAVHGLRIRTSASDKTLHAPLVISIDPKEYASKIVNRGYGGHRPGSSGIYTDIGAGTSIFRELAPLVGNPVFLERSGGRLLPLPTTFRPTGTGEILVIAVRVPKVGLTSVVFENRRGGSVIGSFADGSKHQITTVVVPVKGVGRFDGTAYTGVGRLNTAHTGVLTISTSPIDGAEAEGVGSERRGGFQISPAWHNNRTEEAGAPMVMTLGTIGMRKRELEGNPPLFRDMIALGPGEHATDPGIANISVDGGAWEPMPTVIGYHPDVFTAAGLTRLWRSMGLKRVSHHGVTAIRLRLPQMTPERAELVAQTASATYTQQRLHAAQAGQEPIVQGLLTINTNPKVSRPVSFVRLAVEGSFRSLTNVAPFTLSWDTTRVPDGEYLIEAVAMDRSGEVVATTRRRVFVRNKPVSTIVNPPSAGG